MKGLELSEKFFEMYGRQLLENDFSELLPRVAVGLVGEGSECLGYDDEISHDHDFEHGFCIFLTKEDYEKYGFKLSRAYNKLPNEFMGFKKLTISPAGGARHGVFEIDEFFTNLLGCIPQTNYDFLSIPSYALRTATSGKIFFDNLNVFTNIYNSIKKYPEDVRLKKLSANALCMSQDGQYNYARSIQHGERGASVLCLNNFVKHAISTIYLLNNVYEPFYKWAFRGLRDLPILAELEEPLIFLLEGENTDNIANGKREIIEDIATMITDEYKNQGITSATCHNLDTHSRSICDHIKDANLRNSNLFLGL